MKIYGVKINGLRNPIGYAFQDIVVSWKVKDAADKRQKTAKVMVAYDKAMQNIAAQIQGDLNSCAQKVDVQLSPRTEYFVQVYVEGDGGEAACSEIAAFETGKREEAWQAKWITTDKEDTYHPVFRKEFKVSGNVKKARLYICGVGLYEAYLGDNKIGGNYLAPFFNDYHCALQSQTYDVTELLERENTLSVLLGNGWYKGRLGYEGKSQVYGDQFACIAELHIEYEDGACEVITTDTSWSYRGSDIEYSDIYDGEGINRLMYEDKANPDKPAVLLEKDPGMLTDCYSMPLKVMEQLPVKEIICTPSGETVLDFGQNFAGYLKFYADLPKGTKVVLTHGEVLQNGNFYHDNYRTAKTELVYTSDGTAQWVCPHFTYMGFRYVKAEGWTGQIKKENFVGEVVYSAMERTGYLESGNAKLNQLISNALWGMKSNFLDMPTDCPQRDERLGWTGDAQVFAPTASFFMDTKAFYRKFLWDMRNDQLLRGGAIANYLPNINEEPGGSSVWGDAATFIPMTVYEAYGDKSALNEVYPLMKDWLEWIRRGDEKRPGGPTGLFDFAFSFGDWLAMDGVTEQSLKGGTEDAYVSSVYYYASARKVAQAAKILGKELESREYENLAEKIRTAILHEYFAPSGRLTMDTQTGYIIALYFGIYIDREVLKRDLRKRLKKDAYRIKCGFVGAPLLCETLAQNGMEDLAFHMLLQEEFPSWLHCVSLGATTIWERWNSILDDGSISGTGMNSLNHYAYGSVMNYVKSYIAGLRALEPGYRKVLIAPEYDIRISYMNCCYDSACGQYEVSWRINENGTVTVHMEIPFGCEAVVRLPGICESEILEQSGLNLENRTECTVLSGAYEITYRPVRNYRKRYTWNSMLEDLRKDSKAMQILMEKLPAAYGMAMSDDLENQTLMLDDLKYMPWFGLDPAAVEKAAEELLELE